MKKRRSPAEVAVDVLEACRGGAIMTRVMRDANINALNFHRHIDPLIQTGYIETAPTRRRGPRTHYRYTATMSGIYHMRALKAIHL